MGKQITSISAASKAAGALCAEREVLLPGGRRVRICRLSWIKFELLWEELALLLAALLAEGDDSAAESIGLRLAGAPAFAIKLCCLSADMAESELSSWSFDEVLALAAECLSLNFAESAGVRDFFTALGRLSEPQA